MINSVTLAGNLTRDPELRNLPSGVAVTNFSLACDGRRYKNAQGEWTNDTVFVDCEAWDKGAERLSQLKKGNKLVVTGSLKTDKWTDAEGKNRSKMLVRCEEFYLAEIVRSPVAQNA